MKIEYYDTIIIPKGIYDGTIKSAVAIPIKQEIINSDLAINITGTSYNLKVNTLGDCGKNAIVSAKVFNKNEIETGDESDDIGSNFSPNGDGINDYLLISKVGDIEIITESGNSAGYITGPLLWDGTTNEGLILSTGYYLLKESNGKTHEITIFK